MLLLLELLAIALIFFVPIAIFIFPIAGKWGVFKKAGEKGWKALIPFYETYTMLKIGGKKNIIPLFWVGTVMFLLGVVGYIASFVGMFSGAIESLENIQASVLVAEGFAGLLLSTLGVAISNILNFIVQVHAYAGICTKMEQDGAMTVGLLMLPFVFWMVLGYSAKYQWHYDVNFNAFYGNAAEEDTVSP